MSISAYIKYPRNIAEKDFYLPVAARIYFENSWLPVAEVLGLNNIKSFQIGLDVYDSNVNEVMDELEIFKKWVIEHLYQEDQEEKCFILGRIQDLENMLKTFIGKEGLSVYIG